MRSFRSLSARLTVQFALLFAGALLGEAPGPGARALAGCSRQLVAAPITPPTLIGWVVFAADLDAREMRSLERLSAIPLHAAVLANSSGRSSEAAGSMSTLSGEA